MKSLMYRGVLMFALLMFLQVAVVAAGNWRPVGTGDCPGRDIDSSQGPNPDARRCSPSSEGLTAVCWDSSCTYKDLAAESCTGGNNPGRMYVCEPSAPQTPATPPRGSEIGEWELVGTGDCPGRDVASSRGPNPEASRCSPSSNGHTAVCWDGSCTYKNVPTGSCTGGRNPGRMYTCKAASEGPTHKVERLRDDLTRYTIWSDNQDPFGGKSGQELHMGQHYYCSLSYLMPGGFNSACGINLVGENWILVALDPKSPDPWTGESQGCSAICVDR